MAESSAKAGARRGALARFAGDYSREIGLAVLIAVICAVVYWFKPNFLSPVNVSNVLRFNAYVGVAAIGMTMIIIMRHIDISIGAIVGVSAVVATSLARDGYSNAVAWTAPILVGMAISLVNGLLVTYGRIPAIVATLGTLSILKGGMIVVTGGEFVTGIPRDFMIATVRVFNVSITFWIMIALGIATAIWMRYSATGRAIYAIGGNAAAARATGINERRITLIVFAIHGAFGGLAGLFYGSQAQNLQSAVPANIELNIIAAAVIGGVSVMGGVGTVIGALMATMFFAFVNSALLFLSVSAFWVKAVQGVMILGTLMIDLAKRWQK